MRPLTRLLVFMARASNWVSVLFDYLAASTCRLADLKEGIRHAWQGFNVRDADVTSGLMSWEDDLLRRFVKPGAAVLIVGCGSGRDVLPLVERGCRVTGIDPAADALALARRTLRERGLSAKLVEGFFEDIPLVERFDAVIFSYYSYSYIPESARRVRSLRKAAEHLTPGGHILISYPGMSWPRPVMIHLARRVGMLSGSDWRLEPGDHVFRLALPGGFTYSYAHAFQPREVETEAGAAGLRTAYRHDVADQPVVALALARA